MKTIKINGLEIELAEGLELIVEAGGKLIVRHAAADYHPVYVPIPSYVPATPFIPTFPPVWTQPTTVPWNDPYRPTITCEVGVSVC